uniref:Variant surface glycoprotein 587 n=1 Tax=Trypanosoma brucei TaxID=5691 RepID=M4TDK7_9TRYP|nr:variant surface glycoprotein 587 [Trypanosoma brucei]
MYSNEKFAFLLFVTTMHLIKADNEPFKEAGLGKLCSLSSKQKAVSKEVTGSLHDYIAKHINLRAFETKLSLLITENSNFAGSALLLAIATTKLIQDHATGIPNLALQGAHTAAETAYAAGRTDELVNFLKQTAHPTTDSHSCIEFNSGPALTAGMLSGCDTPTFTGQTTIITATTEAAQSEVPGDAELQGSGSKNCKLTADDGTGLFGGTNAISLKLLDGFYTHTKRETWSGTPRIKTVADSKTLDAAQTAAQSLQPLLQDNWPAAPTDEQTLTAFINNPKVQQQIEQSLKETKDLATSAGQSELNNKVNSIFGAPLPNGTRPFASEVAHKRFQVKGTEGNDKLSVFQLTPKQAVQLMAEKIAALKQEAKKPAKVECPKGPDGREQCNAIDKQDKCDEAPQCTWHMTVKDGGKKCQFNSTKATESGVPVAQSQTGGTQTYTDKCKDKKKDDCKSPDWKWEENKCKDSSFLVNKKMALSMAADFVG